MKQGSIVSTVQFQKETFGEDYIKLYYSHDDIEVNRDKWEDYKEEHKPKIERINQWVERIEKMGIHISEMIAIYTPYEYMFIDNIIKTYEIMIIINFTEDSEIEDFMGPVGSKCLKWEIEKAGQGYWDKIFDDGIGEAECSQYMYFTGVSVKKLVINEVY